MGFYFRVLAEVAAAALFILVCFWPFFTMRWMRDVLDFTKDYGGPTVCSAVGVYAGYRLLRRRSRKNAIAARGEEASQARQAAESHLKSVATDTLLTRDGRPIVDLPLNELIEEIESGRLSAVQVLRSFMLKALEVTHNVNCVTEPVSPEQCEAMADLLDTKFSEEDDKSNLGMLHGLPVSIKENIDIAGMHSTMGLLRHAQSRATRDAVLVRVLRAHGAIPFVKTNLPQTMISFDCSNPLYGITRNPYDLSRTPGGSSGGEAALMASGGSQLGLGTDIGGSVRLPAAFCGVCGFKPTQGRLSGVGVQTVLRGQSGVSLSPGVMARDVAGCELLMKALCSPEMFEMDSSVVPMRLDDAACSAKRRLRVGYFKTEGFFHATPANQRAVAEACDALRRAGHEVVEYPAPDFFEMMSLYYKLVLSDGMDTVMQALDGDDVDPSIWFGYFIYNIPPVVRRLVSGALYYVSRRMTALLGNLKHRSVQELWQLQRRREDDAKEYCSRLRAHRLDGLICPIHAIGAIPSGTCAKITASCCYSALANMYNLPSGVVPVTRATQQDEDELATYQHSDIWGYTTKKLATGMVGLPIGVQCLTPTWRDEDCLYLMKELEASLRA